jgi:hypothetical protein
MLVLLRHFHSGRASAAFPVSAALISAARSHIFSSAIVTPRMRFGRTNNAGILREEQALAEGAPPISDGIARTGHSVPTISL